MSVEDFSAGIGEERFNENGQSEAGVGDTSSSTQEAAVEDKPFPIPQSLSETGGGAFWDEILVSVIVVVASFVRAFNDKKYQKYLACQNVSGQ
jgi:hypothetical protein